MNRPARLILSLALAGLSLGAPRPISQDGPREGPPKFPIPAGQQELPKCLCVTSVEDVLWSKTTDQPMGQASAAIDTCTDRSMFLDGVGVVTTNSSTKDVRRHLKKLNYRVFTHDLLHSDAIQVWSV